MGEVDEATDLSPKQAAKRLGYTAAWVRHLCRTGQLGYRRRKGAEWRITTEEVERLRRGDFRDREGAA